MEFVPTLFYWQLMVTALAILCMVSLIIGFNSKEKSFSFYGIYTFFLLLYFVLMAPYDFPWRDQLFNSPLRALRWYSQVIYNCAYFVFFLYFLDIKSHLYKFYKFIVKVVGIAFTAGTLVFIYALLTKDPRLFDYFYIYVFVPILFGFGVYTLIRAWALPGKLKYFLVIGGGVFITCAMIALFFPIMGWPLFNIKAFTLFYVGIFIEQFVFAYGLAYKIKIVNRSLLEKSRENQQIREDQNELLAVKLKEKESELLAISARAEEARITRMRSKFEDQIHHLHLVSLQNQMNPHFIFNALNSIKVFLIENEKQKAVYYLNKFSKLIRHILGSTEVESINLKEELRILELYVSIENIRFEDKVEMEVKNPENINLRNIMLPPMILQPFIENAIWHGLMLKKGKKKIDIEFSQKQDAIIMRIRDNGIGRQKSKQNSEKRAFRKESIGLDITERRLKHFNQKQNFSYKFKINDLNDEKGEPTGTEIEFVFRYQKH